MELILLSSAVVITMIKWISRLLGLGILAFVAVFLYYDYRAGYFTLRGLPDNAYPLSFSNGFRAIVYDPVFEEEPTIYYPRYFRRLNIVDRQRRYKGIEMIVPEWFEHVWSECEHAPEGSREDIDRILPDDMRSKYATARLDYLCFFEADGKKLPRGVIFSVPRV